MYNVLCEEYFFKGKKMTHSIYLYNENWSIYLYNKIKVIKIKSYIMQ